MDISARLVSLTAHCSQEFQKLRPSDAQRHKQGQHEWCLCRATFQLARAVALLTRETDLLHMHPPTLPLPHTTRPTHPLHSHVHQSCKRWRLWPPRPTRSPPVPVYRHLACLPNPSMQAGPREALHPRSKWLVQLRTSMQPLTQPLLVLFTWPPPSPQRA